MYGFILPLTRKLQSENQRINSFFKDIKSVNSIYNVIYYGLLAVLHHFISSAFQVYDNILTMNVAN